VRLVTYSTNGAEKEGGGAQTQGSPLERRVTSPFQNGSAQGGSGLPGSGSHSPVPPGARVLSEIDVVFNDPAEGHGEESISVRVVSPKTAAVVPGAAVAPGVAGTAASTTLTNRANEGLLKLAMPVMPRVQSLLASPSLLSRSNLGERSGSAPRPSCAVATTLRAGSNPPAVSGGIVSGAQGPMSLTASPLLLGRSVGYQEATGLSSSGAVLGAGAPGSFANSRGLVSSGSARALLTTKPCAKAPAVTALKPAAASVCPAGHMFPVARPPVGPSVVAPQPSIPQPAAAAAITGKPRPGLAMPILMPGIGGTAPAAPAVGSGATGVGIVGAEVGRN